MPTTPPDTLDTLQARAEEVLEASRVGSPLHEQAKDTLKLAAALRAGLALADKWEGHVKENEPLAADGSYMAAGYMGAYRLAATNLRAATTDAVARA
jgi:hypothetical protein